MRSWIIVLAWLAFIFTIAAFVSCKGPKAQPQESRPVGIELAAADSLGAVLSSSEVRYQGLTPRQKKRQMNKDRKAIVKLAKIQAKAGPRKIKIVDRSKSKEKPVTKIDNSQGKGVWKTWAALWVVAGAVVLFLVYFPRLKKFGNNSTTGG